MTKVLTTKIYPNILYIVDILNDIPNDCIRAYVRYSPYFSEIGRMLDFHKWNSEWETRDLTKEEIEKYFVELL